MQLQSKTRWDAENTVALHLKLFRKGDADILEFLRKAQEQGESRTMLIRQALREYIQNHDSKKGE